VIERSPLLAADGPLRARRAVALDLAEAALAAVEPEAATARVLAGRTDLQGCVVLAFGKAAVPMARAALACCAPRGGVVVGLGDPGVDLGPLRVRQGRHPLPALDAAEHGAEVVALAESLGQDDVVLCLVSGGGSALLELPRPGVTMAQIRALTDEHLKGGAPIAELNAARTALSALKGGGLATVLLPARVVNIVLSDVPGQPLSLVASGPTVRDDPRIETIAAADNDAAVQGVLQAGADRGLVLRRLEMSVVGEARLVGRELTEEAVRAFASDPGLDGLVGGGETTVTVRGTGRGGRNGELVLGAAPGLGSHLVLSLATDGLDGSSDSAGAVLDSQLLADGPGPIGPALDDNDSATWLAAAGALLHTGPTGTNVADVTLILR
jgi:glycerate 2-kinase